MAQSQVIPPPATRRPAAAAVPSPHYQIRDHKRHSLYGTDDRIVLDLGASVWKVGFSGEASPRQVLAPTRPGDGSTQPQGIWEVEFEDVARAELEDGNRWWQRWEDWERADLVDEASQTGEDEASLREIGEQMVDTRVGDRLREVFSRHLMTDPKSRKVIVVENPLLPTRIKEIVARRLFEDLQVPSISFFPPHLLSLLATGRTSGLVVDVGHLETVVLPIHLSRPLFPLLSSSSVASRHLHRSLYLLLLHYAVFIPPVPTLSAAAALGGGRGRAREAGRVTREVLRASGVVERILTEGCFIGPESGSSSSQGMDVDDRPPQPPTPTPDPEPSPVASSSTTPDPPLPFLPSHLVKLQARYSRGSIARPLRLAVPASANEGLAGGTLVVPGWIRERVAEDFFEFEGPGRETSEREERSVVQLVLATLKKLPIDIRRPLASSILVTGGGAMLPGFIPRLRSSLLLALDSTSPPLTATPSRRRPHPYASILPLAPHLAILNDPSPPSPGHPNAGAAPAFAPSLLAWVGASLAGSLRAGATAEITRERWDEAKEGRRKRFLVGARATAAAASEASAAGGPASVLDEEMEWEGEQFVRGGGVEVLGDWTRPQPSIPVSAGR